MEKNSGTRSGLLWEVERLLNECTELPQILLMENVPQVHGSKNKVHFDEWIEFLESKGYTNYWQDLNAKNYGIPQNRNRCFMVSVLDNKPFEFPEPLELKLRLKDMLEQNVDEKYYLSSKMVDYITADNEKWTGNNNHAIVNKSIASTLNTGEGQRRCDASNYICDELPENFDLKQVGKLCVVNCNKSLRETLEKNEVTEGVVVKGEINIIGNYSPSGQEASRIVHPDGIAPTVKENHGTVTATVVPPLRIRKLTPKECWRLMGFSDTDFDKAAQFISNTQLYKQAGNSIVVDVLENIFRELFLKEQDISSWLDKLLEVS